MANLALIYGLRLFPAEDLEQVGDAAVQFKNGRHGRVRCRTLSGGGKTRAR